MTRPRVMYRGEAGEVVLWLMPAGLLAGIGARSGDWVLVAGVVGLVLVFAGLVLWLWLSNREQRPSPPATARPPAIEAPKPVSPLAAGAFVVDAVPAETGGA